ncbi:hypothetical protein DPMN_031258 [Dreissena polymorpha]|uniref:Uncharacterized protein n=1 Tax=Dreissena polymorpha TaxID=45954 RepID=A0A9D4M2F9_DREPO|nr:hypothetical protein DPMN_031258 [Dreissena polymorpha]
MVLEKKVDNLSMELKRLWTAIEDRNRKSEEMITKVKVKAYSVDFSIGMVNSKMAVLEKTNGRLQEDATYLQSHSMRNNQMFSEIPVFW